MLGELYALLGEAYADLREWRLAGRSLNIAVDILSKRSDSEANTNQLLFRAELKAGEISEETRDYSSAEKRYWKAIDVANGLGNDAVALAANRLAGLLIRTRSFSKARSPLQQALDLHPSSKQVRSALLNNLAVLELEDGQFAEARKLLEESASIKELLGDDVGASNTFRNLSIVERMAGNEVAASQRLETSREILRSNIREHVDDVNSLIDSLLAQDPHATSELLVRSTEAIQEEAIRNGVTLSADEFDEAKSMMFEILWERLQSKRTTVFVLSEQISNVARYVVAQLLKSRMNAVSLSRTIERDIEPELWQLDWIDNQDEVVAPVGRAEKGLVTEFIDPLEFSELKVDLEEILPGLSEKDREAILMYFAANVPLRSIATAKELDLAYLKRLMRRARTRLRKELSAASG